MLRAGIIRHSTSPWSFPLVMIPKIHGTSRMCVDYRKLNKITVTDPFPIQRTDEIFDSFQGATCFSAIDLKSGFWQIEMDEHRFQKPLFQLLMDTMSSYVFHSD